MKVVKPRVGYTDLKDEPEDGRRYEIYDGEVFVVPSPAPPHQTAAWNLAALLRDYQLAFGGLAWFAPLDIVFSEYDVLQPDLVYFRPERAPLIAPERWDPVRVPPDLAIEVLSPSTESRDRGPKLQMFARYGVPEYWIVDPRTRSVEVLRLDGAAYTIAQRASEDDAVISATLSGLTTQVSSIFSIPEKRR